MSDEVDRDIEANTRNGIEMSPRRSTEEGRRDEDAPLLEEQENREAPPSLLPPTNEPVPKPYEAIRTEPLKSMDTRKRRLDRVTDDSIPELHIVGQIKAGSGIVQDLTEGAFCRYKMDIGKICQHLGGDLTGQTQVAYCRHDVQEFIPFCHPVDLHFAMTGLQGWGSPRVSLQVFRLDWFGRRVLAGYGFVHIPLTPGRHVLEVNLWRPLGTPDQEVRSFLLGETPSLVSHDPLYESAWRDRCRLLTTSAGKVILELFVISRFLKEQGVIQNPQR